MPCFHALMEKQKRSWLRGPSWAIKSVPVLPAAFTVVAPYLVGMDRYGPQENVLLAKPCCALKLWWHHYSDLQKSSSGQLEDHLKGSLFLDHFKMYQWPQNTGDKEPGRCWCSSSSWAGWPLPITPHSKCTPQSRAHGNTGGQGAYSPLAHIPLAPPIQSLAKGRAMHLSTDFPILMPICDHGFRPASTSKTLATLEVSFKCSYWQNRPDSSGKGFTCFCLFWFGEHLHQVTLEGLYLFYWCGEGITLPTYPMPFIGNNSLKILLILRAKNIVIKAQQQNLKFFVRPLVLVCSPRI